MKLCLQLHYVDSVVIISRSVTRTYPRFLSWSRKSLNARQDVESENGFGVGFIEYDDKIPSEAKLITWKPEDCKESRATEIDEEEPQPTQNPQTEMLYVSSSTLHIFLIYTYRAL